MPGSFFFIILLTDPSQALQLAGDFLLYAMISKNPYGEAWRKKRKAILSRDQYECKYWSRYGIKKPAALVHHIFPVEFFPELRLVNWNLISLSNEAHEMMHDRNDNGNLSEEGIKLAERTAIKNNHMEYFERLINLYKTIG